MIIYNLCYHPVPAYDAQRINYKKISASSKSIISLLNYENEVLGSLREKMFKYPKEIKASEHGIAYSLVISEYNNVGFYRLRFVRVSVRDRLVSR